MERKEEEAEGDERWKKKERHACYHRWISIFEFGAPDTQVLYPRVISSNWNFLRTTCFMSNHTCPYFPLSAEVYRLDLLIWCVVMCTPFFMNTTVKCSTWSFSLEYQVSPVFLFRSHHLTSNYTNSSYYGTRLIIPVSNWRFPSFPLAMCSSISAFIDGVRWHFLDTTTRTILGVFDLNLGLVLMAFGVLVKY
jgi:hypothetical protein